MRLVSLLLISAFVLAFAQTPQSIVYLDPQSQFTPDFSAAIQKKNVPVTVTTDPSKAEYNIKFSVSNNEGSIVTGITRALTTGTYNDGAWNRATIQVIDTKSKNQVFSYTCKKYSNNGDEMVKSVAECLAKHWKSNIK